MGCAFSLEDKRAIERSRRIDAGLQEEGSAGDRVKLLLLGKTFAWRCGQQT